MPAATSESLLSSALSKVKHRNHDLVKRDVMTTLLHYRGLVPKPDKFIFNDGTFREMINIHGTIPVPYKGQNYNIPVSLWVLDTHPYHAPVCFVKPTAEMQIKVSKHVDQSGKIYLPYLHEWSHPKSDLLGLVQILIVTFSEQPPVYSKPKQEQSPPPQQQAAQYPVYPPTVFPGAGFGSQYQGFAPNPAYAFAPSSATAAYQQQQQHQQQNNFYNNSSPQNQDQAKQQILSNAEEKVKMRLREEISQKQMTTEEYRKIGDKLNDGRSSINKIMAKLKEEISVVEDEVNQATKSIDEMKATKERLSTAGDVDCDEAVTATAPVFKQLLQAHAEDAAVEDALYFLGESLRRGTTDCEAFLKHVRNLSRRQFILRATMQKCRQTGGLPS